MGWRKSISGFPSGRAEPRWGEQALAAPPVLPFPQLLPARAAGPAHAPGGGSWARSHRDRDQTAPLAPRCAAEPGCGGVMGLDALSSSGQPRSTGLQSRALPGGTAEHPDQGAAPPLSTGDRWSPPSDALRPEHACPACSWGPWLPTVCESHQGQGLKLVCGERWARLELQYTPW